MTLNENPLDLLQTQAFLSRGNVRAGEHVGRALGRHREATANREGACQEGRRADRSPLGFENRSVELGQAPALGRERALGKPRSPISRTRRRHLEKTQLARSDSSAQAGLQQAPWGPSGPRLISGPAQTRPKEGQPLKQRPEGTCLMSPSGHSSRLTG